MAKKLIEKVKENKKIHDAKIEVASKMLDEASEEFAETYKSLIEESSVEEFKEFIESDSEFAKEFFGQGKMLRAMTIALFCNAYDIGIVGIGFEIK